MWRFEVGEGGLGFARDSCTAGRILLVLEEGLVGCSALGSCLTWVLLGRSSRYRWLHWWHWSWLLLYLNWCRRLSRILRRSERCSLTRDEPIHATVPDTLKDTQRSMPCSHTNHDLDEEMLRTILAVAAEIQIAAHRTPDVLPEQCLVWHIPTDLGRFAAFKPVVEAGKDRVGCVVSLEDLLQLLHRDGLFANGAVC